MLVSKTLTTGRMILSGTNSPPEKYVPSELDKYVIDKELQHTD
jgi:hypothetical protein